jgi:hypothetical protein
MLTGDLARIEDELRRAYDGDCWHGPPLREVLKGVSAETAQALHPQLAHSIWALVNHLAAWVEVVARRISAGGDFFKAVPPADAFVMKHIIHDWPDDKSTTILRNCRKAANPAAKLILVEMVIPPGNGPAPGKLLDLEMLVIASGKERTEAEYAELFSGAGWRLTRVVPTRSPTSVIEGEAV